MAKNSRAEALAERKAKLKAAKQKLKDRRSEVTDKVQAKRAEDLERLVPVEEGDEWMERIHDYSSSNVGNLGGMFSINPWLGICGIPHNINPYRGCSNFCSYCFVNQFNRGRMARTPGLTDRSFYGAIPHTKSLDKMLHVAQGVARLEDVPESQRLYAWFYEQRIPVRLSALTDPFMKVERHYRRTLEVLQKLKAASYPVVITTKAGDLFKDTYFKLITGLPLKVLQVSLISVDDEVVADFEPTSPPAHERLEAIKAYRDAGVYVSVRMAPVIPDDRIFAREHMVRYAQTLSELGVTFVEINPLHLKQGIQTQTENPALLSVIDKLDSDLYVGNRLSVPPAMLREWGEMTREIFAEYGIEYGQHYLGRYEPFHSDYDSAIHCAKLEQVPGFESYYKATFSQLLLDAKRMWEQHRMPVLLTRTDLDKYPHPKGLIVPARSKENQVPWEKDLDNWWYGIGDWFWVPPYIFPVGSDEQPWTGLDWETGNAVYVYQNVPGADWFTSEGVAEGRTHFAEQGCILLDGTRLPFPEDNPDHFYWRRARAAFARFQ